MNQHDTSSAEFFEQKYSSDPQADPWSFATSPYELQRYDAVMAAIAGQRYMSAFEPGCSVGVLTQRLASVCDAVQACDFSPSAAAAAADRCAQLPNVTVRCRPFTGNEPWASFDLVVLCEIGYYFTAAAWQALVAGMVRNMQPGTALLASHWLGTSVDHVQHGDAVHAALAHPLLRQTISERHEGFLLQRWTRQ